MIRGNYHTHTVFCDGADTPREMIEAALALGFDVLGFSGHVDLDPVLDLDVYCREIRALAAEYGPRIEVLCGGEVDRLYPDKSALQLDYIIGSNHHLTGDLDRPMAVDHSEQVLLQLLNDGFAGDVYRMTRAYFENVAKVYRETRCHFVGHFDLITKYNGRLHLIDEADPRYLDPAFDAMDRLISEGMRWFEINTRMAATGRIYPSERLLRHLRQRGGEILISSDAHAANELDRGFDAAKALALRCGFDHANALTMRSGRLEYVEIAL